MRPRSPLSPYAKKDLLIETAFNKSFYSGGLPALSILFPVQLSPGASFPAADPKLLRGRSPSDPRLILSCSKADPRLRFGRSPADPRLSPPVLAFQFLDLVKHHVV